MNFPDSGRKAPPSQNLFTEAGIEPAFSSLRRCLNLLTTRQAKSSSQEPFVLLSISFFLQAHQALEGVFNIILLLQNTKLEKDYGSGFRTAASC